MRLTGDSSSYTKMLADAAASSKTTYAQIGTAADNLTKQLLQQVLMLGKGGDSAAVYALKLAGATDAQLAAARAMQRLLDDAMRPQLSMFEKLTVGVRAFSGTLTRMAGMAGVTTGVMSSFGRYAEAQRMQARLNAMIEVGGHDVLETRKRYDEFADTMSRMTLQSRGSTLALLQQAEAFGLSGAKAEKAVKDAVAAAGFKGGDPSSFIRMTAMMQSGDPGRLGVQFGVARTIHDKDKILAEIDKRLKAGMELAEQDRTSPLGQLTKTKQEMAKFSVEIGALMSTAVLPAIEGLTRLVEGFNSMGKAARTSVAGVLAVAGALTSFLTVSGVVVQNVMALGSALSSMGATWKGTWAAIQVTGTVAAVVGVMYGLARAIDAVIMSSSGLGDALRDNEKSMTGLVQTIGTRGTDKLSKIKLISDPEQQKKELDAYIKMIKDRMPKMEEDIEAQRKHLGRGKESSPWLGAASLLAPGTLLVGGEKARGSAYDVMSNIGTKFLPSLTAAEEQTLKFSENTLDAWNKILRSAEQAREAMVPKDASLIQLERMDDAIKKIREHMVTIGLTGAEAQAARFEFQMGPEASAGPNAQEKLNELLFFGKWEEDEKAIQKVKDEVDKLVKSTQEHMMVMGKTSLESHYYKIRMEEAATSTKILTDAQRSNIQGMIRMERNKKVFDEAKKLTEQFATPEEKYLKKIAEIDKVWKTGEISVETYSAAIEDAGKILHQSANEAQRFNAAVSGSAEALQNVQDYFDRNKWKPLELPPPDAATAVRMMVGDEAAEYVDVQERLWEGFEEQ